MTDEKKNLLKTIGMGILKCFRGLIAENKNGGWEVSKGSVGFWIVFGHCVYVWNTIVQSVVDGVTTITRGSVSDGEVYTLWALLGYAGLKVGTDMVKTSVDTWKNSGQESPGA